MKKIKLTEEIWKEGEMYVSFCPELDVAACGETIEQAKKNLIEVIEINIEETKKKGTFQKFLNETGFIVSEGDTLYLKKEVVGFEAIEIAI
ncbi:MAG: type II toxin-antitoxin system HicB family antitoxin [Ignavibacteria bacterium]